MKRTAGELTEIIPLKAECKGNEVEVSAICPFCGRSIRKLGQGNTDVIKEAALNGAIAHIRCLHLDD